ncbi:hypothetical protein [Halapricum hydrolyticum]|uniref:NUDIX hydrolase n=1 Tax=Halapricum hydrolyticum TaxID=2979991 RepID=A0AAE3IH94_9EURY|nr:hypothetical protein [Halapricum hydrolyticum]MCU4719345.1 hypothetical protein [Halapricum hydrolyticum]MCU4728390.1 hypothetical protein [Halapricum hydrolyticum]
MTDTSTDIDRDEAFDPEAAAGRRGISYEERTYVHESTDHCEADGEGRVVVGVTDEEGAALLLVDQDRSIAMLPNATIDAGDGWLPAGRRAVADATGLEVTIGDPVRVRRIEHTTEESDTPHNATWHVVFRASPTGCDPAAPDDTPFEAGWYERLPVEMSDDPSTRGDALADVRSFLTEQ